MKRFLLFILFAVMSELKSTGDAEGGDNEPIGVLEVNQEAEQPTDTVSEYKEVKSTESANDQYYTIAYDDDYKTIPEENTSTNENLSENNGDNNLTLEREFYNFVYKSNELWTDYEIRIKEMGETMKQTVLFTQKINLSFV